MGDVIHLVIGLLSLAASLGILIPFWKNRNHYLINYYNYYGFRVNLFIGILSSMTMLINALAYFFEMKCIVNTVVTIIGACVPMAIQCGRYANLILMNKANIIKTRLLSFDKNSNFLPNNNEDCCSKIDFINESTNDTLKGETNIEKAISRKYLYPIYVIFSVIIVISSIICFVMNKNILNEKCQSSSWKLFIPAISTSFIFTAFLPYFFAYTFKHLSKEKKIDLVVFFCFLLTSGLGFAAAKLNIIKVGNSSYFFYMAYFANLVSVILLPVINVYRVKFKTENKTNKEDFINLLFDGKFVSLLKEQSIQLFCVENVLFWEMHQMLMSLVLKKYLVNESEKKKNKVVNKKNTTKAEVGSYHFNKNITPINSYADNKLALENSAEDDNGMGEHIDVIVERDESCYMGNTTSNTLGSDSTVLKDVKAEHSDDNIIHFVNDQNITFFGNESTTSLEISSKIDILYNSILKEYAQSNGIKLTKKEQMIDSFLIDGSLKKYFRKIYDIFIDPNGMSPLNISNAVLEEVKEAIGQDSYSHKIFKMV